MYTSLQRDIWQKRTLEILNIYTLDLYVLLMFAFSTGPGGRREEEEGETGGKVAEGKVAQAGEVAP